MLETCQPGVDLVRNPIRTAAATTTAPPRSQGVKARRVTREILARPRSPRRPVETRRPARRQAGVRDARPVRLLPDAGAVAQRKAAHRIGHPRPAPPPPCHQERARPPAGP